MREAMFAASRKSGQAAVRRAGAALLLVLGTSGLAAAAPLEGGGDLAPAYSAWLQALAGDAAAPADTSAAASAGAPSFYPLPMPPGGAARPRLASSRAVQKLEAGPSATRARLAADPEQSAATAADYRNLGEYAQVLRWQGETARLGGAAPSALLEATAAAAVLDDSLCLVEGLVDGTGGGLAGRDAEVVLAYRYLATRGDQAGLARLDRCVAAQPAPPSAVVRCWRAFARAAGRDWSGALEDLTALLAAGPGAAADVPARQRLWAATALPDLLLLAGRGAEAEPLYRQLAGSSLDPAAPWGRYQVANLDLLAGRATEAAGEYRRLCAATDSWPWKPRACALAALADTLAMAMHTDGDHADGVRASQ